MGLPGVKMRAVGVATMKIRAIDDGNTKWHKNEWPPLVIQAEGFHGFLQMIRFPTPGRKELSGWENDRGGENSGGPEAKSLRDFLQILQGKLILLFGFVFSPGNCSNSST